MKATRIYVSIWLSVTVVSAEETVVTPGIESVALFKNGLAVVSASFPVKGAGQYRWDKVPRVVHGSFWVESDGQISVQSTTRMIEVTGETESQVATLQKDLAGKDVTVTVKSMGTSAPWILTGKVWDVPPPEVSKSWDAEYSSLNPNQSPYHWGRQLQIQPPNPATGDFLVLLEDGGTRRYIERSGIISISVNGPFAPAKKREDRPVLLFDVRQAPASGGVVRVTYLTKGLAWLPAYQVDLTDPATLRIRQNAVVRNESGDLADTEIQLISGYPNVRFGAVDSPLWPGTGLAAFFQQVNQSGTAAGGITSNMASQQMIHSNGSIGGGGSTPLPEAGEQGSLSDDIHYESIGRHSLKAGDSLSLDIAAAKAAYERVVEWQVPDPRDANGRYQRNNEQSRDDQAWDAVRFVNPFKFPMTTAAAMVTENGRFRGQSLSEWVNPGQRASLRITRALSVRTESGEVEEEGQRELIWVGGNDYQRTSVKGRLAVRNFRATEVTVAVRCGFSGELIEADGDPAKSLRTEGVSSVNPRRQLDWTIKLAPGEEKVLGYRYRVLVDR